jgi:hypothetical protein
LASWLTVAACVDAQINRIGPARPALPAGCPVEIVTDGSHPSSAVDVASGEVSCSGQRDRCLAEIRKMACAVGADTVYGLSERTESGFTHISATYAARAAPVQ